MPEERVREDLGLRKARLLARSGHLRERAAELWSGADRPFRVMEEGVARLRRIHPWAAGAGAVGLFLLRRKLVAKRRMLGPLLSLGWMALNLAVKPKLSGRARREE